MYDPSEVGGNHWGNLSSATGYYQNYSIFGGHANSGPVNTDVAGGFSTTTNTTDQFYSGPYFWDHGSPNTSAGASTTAVPWVGDHLVGFNSAADQQMKITFNNGGKGVDEVAFDVVGRSNTQANNQTAANSQWIGGGTNPDGIFEILVQAYDNVDPTIGNLLFSYEIMVGGTTPAFGGCNVARSGESGTGLDQTVPVPCNDAPVIDIKGTLGVYNIRSLVISSSTDAAGFYVDELYYDQGGVGGLTSTPEPGGFWLIGTGLIAAGFLARRRRAASL
jgi:hypothetical protein